MSKLTEHMKQLKEEEHPHQYLYRLEWRGKITESEAKILKIYLRAYQRLMGLREKENSSLNTLY